MQEQQNIEVLKRLQRIENLLEEKKSNLLNFNQTAEYLSISHSHLYKLTSQRKIPFHKPSGKYLYFFKHELDKWIRQNDETGVTDAAEITNTVDIEPGLFDEEVENAKEDPP